MNPDLEVDTDELRRAASALASTAADVVAAGGEAPHTETVPRWAAAGAAFLATEAARQQLVLLGAEIAETARRMATAAGAYEAADARAATRFRLTR
jgi:hypothetical protein